MSLFKIDVSALRYPECVFAAVGDCYEHNNKYPIRIRASYGTLMYLMNSESKWVEFFEDEHGTFLMVTTPIGRVQVVLDETMKAGEGVMDFRDGSSGVGVYFAC